MLTARAAARAFHYVLRLYVVAFGAFVIVVVDFSGARLLEWIGGTFAMVVTPLTV